MYLKSRLAVLSLLAIATFNSYTCTKEKQISKGALTTVLMNIEHPVGSNLNELDGQFLWKYLDLYKLLDLITTKQLHFTRLDHFEDGLEGLTAKAVSLMAFTEGDPWTTETVGDHFTPEEKDELVKEDQSRRQRIEEVRNSSQKTQFANCWFLNDRESLAMWKIYSEKGGVALKFKAKQLVETVIASAESFTSADFHILCYGKVDYKNIWPYDPSETFGGKFNAMKKDRSYVSENEFRFIVVTPTDKAGVHNYFRLPISNLKDYDVEIIANPFIESWQYAGLESLLKNYELEEKLRRSKMKINL